MRWLQANTIWIFELRSNCHTSIRVTVARNGEVLSLTASVRRPRRSWPRPTPTTPTQSLHAQPSPPRRPPSLVMGPSCPSSCLGSVHVPRRGRAITQLLNVQPQSAQSPVRTSMHPRRTTLHHIPFLRIPNPIYQIAHLRIESNP